MTNCTVNSVKNVLLTSTLLAAMALSFQATALAGDDDENSADAPNRGVARISIINGNVSVRRGDSGEAVAAALNAPMTATDRLTTGEGANAGVAVTSADGSVKFGTAAGNTLPSWVPVYPGSTPQGTMSSTSAEGTQNTYTFKTKDSAGKVITYYTDSLKTAGFKIAMTTTTDQGGMVQASDEASKRTVIMTVGSSSDGTEASVTSIEKK